MRHRDDRGEISARSMPRLHSIKKQTAPAAWLLMVLLAFAPLGRHAATAVLCFGWDGHVATELAGGSACIDAPADVPAVPAATDSYPAGASHCGACTDIPIPTGGDTDCISFKTESGPTAQTILSVVALLPAPHHLHAPSPAAQPAQDGQPALPSDPALLRSVVLLI